jgi:copper transport protein
MKRFLLTFLVLVSFPFFRATQVLAHAPPINCEPEASAILERAPEWVRIHFSERIEPKASSIFVFGPDGSRIDEGNAAMDPQNPHFYSISLKEGKPGTCTVSWQVVSADDGHLTKGAFIFLVG